MNLSSAFPAFISRRTSVSPSKVLWNRSRFYWALAAGLIAATCFVVARSCAYDYISLVRYALYLGFYVWLPGCLLLAATQGRRPSLLELIGIGLPLGFAAEICLFLIASAAHARNFLPYTPAFWVVLGCARYPRVLRTLLRRRDHGVGLGTPTACLAVAGLIFALVLTILSNLYAGSPFAGGVLGAATHHDWVYILSRAGEIKTRWPLQDPSMAGQPLSYHYFLLVHLASASLVTGIKLEMLGLRLFVLPLCAALMAQSLYLGRMISKSVWGGVLCTLLLFAANELAFGSGAQGSTFGNEFLSWLFISPTFFFGMVYTGALLVWIHRLLTAERMIRSEWLVLALLATIGTGAKGTVVPPLMLGASIWFVAEWIYRRQFPTKTGAVIVGLAVGFCSVYFTMLSEWGTGATTFSPLASMRLSRFWQDHVDGWRLALENLGMGPRAGQLLATAAGTVAVLIGYSGVRLLSVLAVWRWRKQANPKLTLWLGLMAAVYFVFGNVVMMDSNAQLYLLYPVRLPQAALSAAAILGVVSWVGSRVQDFGGLTGIYGRGVALLFFAAMICAGVASGTFSWWVGAVILNAAAFVLAPSREPYSRVATGGFLRFLRLSGPTLIVSALLVVQVDDWRRQTTQGVQLWLTQSEIKSDRAVTLLRSAMDWIRINTPAEAVFVANAFSDKNLRPNAVAELDHTTVDKYYYYSALAERRLWVEGPTYLRSQEEASRRVAAASRVFYSGTPISALLAEKLAPDYLLIDRDLNDSISLRLPRERCVFENARISIYRLAPAAEDHSSREGLVSAIDRY